MPARRPGSAANGTAASAASGTTTTWRVPVRGAPRPGPRPARAARRRRPAPPPRRPRRRCPVHGGHERGRGLLHGRGVAGGEALRRALRADDPPDVRAADPEVLDERGVAREAALDVRDAELEPLQRDARRRDARGGRAGQPLALRGGLRVRRLPGGAVRRLARRRQLVRQTRDARLGGAQLLESEAVVARGVARQRPFRHLRSGRRGLGSAGLRDSPTRGRPSRSEPSCPGDSASSEERRGAAGR